MKPADHFTVGFMDYPTLFNKPLAATEGEEHYCRGWAAAQRKYGNQLEMELEFDSLLGRDTYANDYRKIEPEVMAQRLAEDRAETERIYRR